MKLKLIIGIVGILSACGFTNAPSLDTNQEKQDNNWVIGPFLRPEGVNPVISPQPTEFYCPMRKQQVKWEESDTFNPCLLYTSPSPRDSTSSRMPSSA